jgi:hypothetical protein
LPFFYTRRCRQANWPALAISKPAVAGRGADANMTLPPDCNLTEAVESAESAEIGRNRMGPLVNREQPAAPSIAAHEQRNP